MEWLGLLAGIVEAKFIQDLALVVLIIGAIRSHIKKIEASVEGIRVEMKDLKGVFREHNKRIGNVEGIVEAIKYEVYEIQQNLKLFKKGD